MKKDIWIALFVISICLIPTAFYFGHLYNGDVSTSKNTNPIIEIYSCKDGRTIRANYTENYNYVSLLLSDERMFDLQRNLSVDGMRYSNKDESTVFWVKGNTARFEENSEVTYAECIPTNN